MISKVAIQTGIGIALVSGVGGGIAILQLNKKDKFDKIITKFVGEGKTIDIKQLNTNLNEPIATSNAEKHLNSKILILQEFIVVTSEIINSEDKPAIEIDNKNYFCKWGEEDNKKSDNNCEIQKIKFNVGDYSDEKTISSFELNDEQKFETPTKNDLETKDNLFKLTITSYDGEISISNTQIDIFSTTKGNKKYGSIKTIARLSHQKNNEEKQIDDIKIGTIDATMDSDFSLDSNITDTSTYKCRWISKNEIASIETTSANDPNLKPCYVYPDMYSIQEETKIISITSNDDFTKDSYYIINFTNEEDFKPISKLLNEENDNWVVFIYVEITNEKNTEIKKIGDFSVNKFLVGNIADTFFSSKFIIYSN